MAGARIQLKRATASAWSSANPVLFAGEIGLETDTNKFKIGDGTTAFNSLPYFNGNLTGSSLNDLADVTIVSASNGDFLRWNGTAWINDAVNLSTDTVGNYMLDVVGGTGVIVSHTQDEGSTASVAIGQDVATTASVTFAHVSADLTGNVTGDLTGNADTATALETARTFSLTGDLSGSVSFDGTSDVTITATVQPNSIALGTDTTGNFVSDVVSGTGVTVTHTLGEGSSASIAIGQDVATTASVTFAHVSADVTGDLTGNADTATTLETARTISLAGDLSGSVSFDGSQNVTVTATVEPNSVALGTDTTGDYVQNLVAGTNVSLANNSGEGSTPTVTVSGNLTGIDSISTPDYIQFDPAHTGTTASAGRLQWSADEGTLELGLEGNVVNLPIGAKQVIYVKNGTGNTIAKAKAVMSTGASGDRINIGLAVADGSVNSRFMLGVTAEEIVDDSLGYVVTNGYIRNIDTDAWNVGTVLYFDPDTPGNLTSTQPSSPDLSLPVAIVTKKSVNAGIIYVRMTLGEYLGEAHDVLLTTPASGDFLKYNGSLWVNDAINLGTDTVGNYVNDIVAGTGVIITHTPAEGSSASIAIGQPVSPSDSVEFVDATITGALVGGAADITVSTTSATNVFTFDKTVYRTGELIVQVSQGSKFTSMKVIILHDGTSSFASQYGVIEIGSPAIPLTVSTDISGDDVRLRVTIGDANSTSAQVKVFPTLLNI